MHDRNTAVPVAIGFPAAPAVALDRVCHTVEHPSSLASSLEPVPKGVVRSFALIGEAVLPDPPREVIGNTLRRVAASWGYAGLRLAAATAVEQGTVTARSDKLQEASFEQRWMYRYVALGAFVLKRAAILGWRNLHDSNSIDFDDPLAPELRKLSDTSPA